MRYKADGERYSPSEVFLGQVIVTNDPARGDAALHVIVSTAEHVSQDVDSVELRKIIKGLKDVITLLESKISLNGELDEILGR